MKMAQKVQKKWKNIQSINPDQNVIYFYFTKNINKNSIIFEIMNGPLMHMIFYEPQIASWRMVIISISKLFFVWACLNTEPWGVLLKSHDHLERETNMVDLAPNTGVGVLKNWYLGLFISDLTLIRGTGILLTSWGLCRYAVYVDWTCRR